MKDFPPNVQIEVTNFCNAKCTICPVKIMKRKRGTMNFELFKKIIDECSKNNFKGVMFPFLEGESLLVPNFLNYLKYIRKKLPYTTINLFTNGSKLSNELGLDILKEDLLDVLTVSFDGGTKESYESIRKGLSFKEVKNNVHNFIKNKNILNKNKPFVEISMVVTKENKNTMEDLKKEFKDADDVTFHKFFNWGGQLKKPKIEKSKIKNFFTKRNFCSRIDNYMTILINGDVALCCWDYEGKVILGNIKNSSIKEVWNGEKFREVRKALKNRDFEKLPLCTNCDFINQNIIYRQIIMMESFLRKSPWLYKRMKNFYVSKV